jgi:hypothetical protein
VLELEEPPGLEEPPELDEPPEPELGPVEPPLPELEDPPPRSGDGLPEHASSKPNAAAANTMGGVARMVRRTRVQGRSFPGPACRTWRLRREIGAFRSQARAPLVVGGLVGREP